MNYSSHHDTSVLLQFMLKLFTVYYHYCHIILPLWQLVMLGFVEFTKLSFALSSLVWPYDQMGSIGTASWFVFIILMHSCYFCVIYPGVVLGLRGSVLNCMTNVDTITSK